MYKNIPSVIYPPFKKTVLAAALIVGSHSIVVAGDLVGRVSDATGAKSLAGAEITLAGTNHRAVTDADGRFRITGLPAGNYTVTIRYVGAGEFSQPVSVGADGIARIDAKMQSTTGIDEILVVGQRGSQASALSRQRSTDSISAFLTRDSIGQFPDQNVSESVRRLQGVSVQNDQGEGRFVVLRGLDPSLNASALNGVRLPSPEADIRGVALDVVPSELIESIEVQKSLIPEMDGDAIGGNVDIRTTSALDRDGPYLGLNGQMSYNDLRDNWSPKVGIDASTLINDDFGISGSFSYFDRVLGSDNIETDDWTEEDGIVYAESFELRNYDVTRTRIGANLGLDYQVSDATTLYARGIYNSFKDLEYRTRLTLDFGDAEPVGGNAGTGANFNLGAGEEIGVERDLKDRTEKQQIYSLQAGGETFADRWTFDYQVAFSHAEEKEYDTFDPTRYERTFEEGELAISQAGLSSVTPQLAIASASTALFNDASEYEFDKVETIDGLTEDEEISARLDIARDFELAGGQMQVKFGGKARWREKDYTLRLDIYDDYNGAGDLLLSDVVDSVDYPLNPLGPVPGVDAVRGMLGDLSDFERNVAESAFESAAPAYLVKEDIYASYLQGRYINGPLTLIGGVRLERTKNDITGNRVDFVEDGATFNGNTVNGDTTFVSPVEFTKKYTDWMPSLILRYEANPDLIVRGAVYRSIVRPNIKDIAPRFVVEQDDNDEREGEFGNPALKPYSAWNFDAGVEWYLADNAVLQGAVFYKSIDDYIASIAFEDITYNGIFANEAVIPLNSENKAKILGFELNYQQVLDMLPEPFDGLLINANYTLADSEGTFNGIDTVLPATSENVLNLALGYEKGPFSLRLAGVYRDEYLDELSADGETDRYVLDHFSLDFSAKYRMNEQTQLFLEMTNLTDEPYVAVVRLGDLGDRLLQYEEYSWTLNAGLRFTY